MANKEEDAHDALKELEANGTDMVPSIALATSSRVDLYVVIELLSTSGTKSSRAGGGLRKGSNSLILMTLILFNNLQSNRRIAMFLS
jgi:hypothetical protein